MNKMKWNLTVIEEKDRKEMEEHVKDDYSYLPNSSIAGVFFNEINHKKGLLSYELVLKKQYFDWLNIGRGLQKLDSRIFFEKHYNWIQKRVDDCFYQGALEFSQRNKSVRNVEIVSSTMTKTVDKNDVDRMTFMVAFVFKHSIVLAMIIFSVRNIINDKNHIFDLMAVMGVSEGVFLLSHIALLLLKQIVYITPIALLNGWAFKNIGIGIMLICACLEFFVVAAFVFLIVSTAPPSAMASFVSVILFMALAISSQFTIATVYDGHYTILYLLNPWAAIMTFIEGVMRVKENGEGNYPPEALFQWRHFHYPGALPLGFVLFDILLWISIGLIAQKWNSLSFSCGKKEISNDNGDNQLFSNAEEEIDFSNSSVDIELSNVSKVYGNGFRAVNEMNMTALRGQVTALLGHNGCGKTTTFSMICGTEKPTEGELKICGHPAGTSKAKSVIGYCSQKNTLLDGMTVMDHLKLVYGLKCASTDFNAECDELLELVGLLDRKKMKVGQLSGGQKRKLCLCMALIGDSKVVLLDEPTAGMDVESRQDIELFLETQKNKRTILLTTHYMDEAESLGDRILIMSAGRVVCSGSTEFLKKRFASGYTLTVLAKGKEKNIEAMAKEIETKMKGYVEKAQTANIQDIQIEYHIPSESPKDLGKLFEDLETNKEKLNMADFGLSMANLENVFLKVGHAFNSRAGEENREERQRELMREVYEDEERQGFSLILAQMMALFKKKFIYSLNHWFAFFFLQLALPVLVLILFVFLRPSSVTTVDESWNVGMAEFGKGDVFIEDFHRGNNRSYFKPVVKKFLKEELKNKKDMRLRHVKPGTLDEYARNKYDDPLPAMAFVFGNITEKDGNGSEITDKRRKTEYVMLKYNQKHLYSLPTILNLFGTARLRRIIPDSRISMNISFAYDYLDGMQLAMIHLSSIGLGILVALTLALLTQPISEDICFGFMHQQILAGTKEWVYWTAEYLFAFLIFMYQSAFFSASLYFLGFNALSVIRIFGLCALLCYCLMPLVFFVSVSFKSPSGATVAIVVMTIVGHYLSAQCDTVAGLFELFVKSENMKVVLQSLVVAGVFPTFGLTEGIQSSKRDQTRKLSESDGFSMASKEFCGYVIAMFCMGTIYNLCFVLYRLKGLKRKCSRSDISGIQAIHAVPVIPPLVDHSTPCDNPLLKVSDLGKRHKKMFACIRQPVKPALVHVSFEVKEKECFGLLGVSGAGKTTVFNILTGQDKATTGTATLEGKNVNDGMILGLCPQFDTLHPALKGRQALRLLAAVHGYKNVDSVVNKLIEMVDMEEHADKKFGNCSGGQKRRLSVAAALLPRKSPFVILDEATAGIDPVARRDVWSVLSVVREHSAILMSSHSMEECEILCSRIAILREGQIAANGTSQELKSSLGDFYSLTLTMPTIGNKEETVATVTQMFPEAVLQKGSFQRNVRFKIPKKKGDKWSTMFSKCSDFVEKLGAVDFCLTQPSLQDIFLIIAGRNEEKKKDSPKTTQPKNGSLMTTTANTIPTASKESKAVATA